MAGSEKTGLEASRAGLYRGAACILTPAPGTFPSAVERLEGFWKTLGCRVVQMDPAEHDNVVARVSHLPHVAAMLAALVALRSDPGRGQFAAGGLRDTTRVASGDPGMWREILLENREALLPALRDLRDASAEVLRAVETGDGDLLSAMLREARDLRALHYS